MKLKKIYKYASMIVAAVLLCTLSTSYAMAANKYVVVIDAGHGGKDHGAIDNNVREKDINLAVALKVGNYIKKHGKNIKVVYTRDKDEYLTLQQRADKANKAKGDLFISIHTNSVDKNNPNRNTVAGASTYTLGLHKNESNMNVARRENSVMTLEPNYETKYSGFDPRSDESYIIFEMAQKANMANSVKFAEQVQKQLTKVASRKDRGVHQAGFWVLWATSMPAVLVELDFICNPTSAKYLSSSEGENQMSKAIGTAAVAYFKALEQHNKNRLRTDAKSNGPAEPSPAFASGEEGVVLASAAEEVKKEAAPQPTPAERTRRPANRRRRSDASREKSERQEYAEAIIKQENAYVDNSTAPSATADPQLTAKAETQNHRANKSSKNDKANKRTTVKKTAAAKQSPAPKSPDKKQVAQKTGKRQTTERVKSPVRLSKVTTVYKIQILSSTERLKAGSPLFQGLTPVTCIAEGDEYKYVYGESTNRNEIYHLLSDVQKKIPDAQVIKVKKAL